MSGEVPLSPEVPATPEPQEPQEQAPDRERLLERVLLAMVVVAVAVVGLPPAVAGLRDGSIELAAVFYPLLLAACAGLAWSRGSSG